MILYLGGASGGNRNNNRERPSKRQRKKKAILGFSLKVLNGSKYCCGQLLNFEINCTKPMSQFSLNQCGLYVTKYWLIRVNKSSFTSLLNGFLMMTCLRRDALMWLIWFKSRKAKKKCSFFSIEWVLLATGKESCRKRETRVSQM